MTRTRRFNIRVHVPPTPAPAPWDKDRDHEINEGDKPLQPPQSARRPVATLRGVGAKPNMLLFGAWSGVRAARHLAIA